MSVSAFLKKYNLTKEDVLKDLKLCYLSREVSTSGSKEVFLGKAAFGIFGGGKEIAQVAMAHFFKRGDFRSGYYRDQTFMFAIGEMTPKQMFSQLYAHSDIDFEPVSAGRLMTGHFGTKLLNDDGSWRNLSDLNNSSTDISPTASQMPRLLGHAFASKLYRQNKQLHDMTQFSKKGNEVAWGTIGNASTSEGMFFETVNAGGVLQVPMLISIWDDEYGISVPNSLQTTKGDISEALSGFKRTESEKGYEIISVNGWDYEALIEAYTKAEKICREEHVPVLVHVKEITQPQGHSTSGSHERYKSKERLDWEKEYDGIKKMTEWALINGVATIEEIENIIKESKEEVKQAKTEAWEAVHDSIKKYAAKGIDLLHNLSEVSSQGDLIKSLLKDYQEIELPLRSHIVKVVKKAIRSTVGEDTNERKLLIEWNNETKKINHEKYSGSLYNHKSDSVLKAPVIDPVYTEKSKKIDGYEILQHFFDKVFASDPRVFAFGEDVGKIGDVNQGMAGLQEKYGELRLSDTGIRECTIVGQAIGSAMRGLKPIAEIQYLDYIMYAIQIISDDLATLQYRSAGQQKAPVIIRTRGHRLQGVWHSGSPLGTILNAVRGVYVCVPRNMTQAAGLYRSLLHSSDPGIVIETLNAYRLKERLPENIGEYTIPLGQVEVLREGSDITIVTYGAMCNIVLEGATKLKDFGIDCEVIDVQTLIPFDIEERILKSIKKTNRVLFADEDVPGGATAYMLQRIVEKDGAYHYLDSKPRTLHSWAHRPAYATDGDFFSKPNSDDVFDWVYEMMHEVNPSKFPDLYT